MYFEKHISQLASDLYFRWLLRLIMGEEIPFISRLQNIIIFSDFQEEVVAKLFYARNGIYFQAFHDLREGRFGALGVEQVQVLMFFACAFQDNEALGILRKLQQVVTNPEIYFAFLTSSRQPALLEEVLVSPVDAILACLGLEAGWHYGEGQYYPTRVIKELVLWWQEKLEPNLPKDITKAYIYPRIEGGIQIEWDINKKSISLEVDFERKFDDGNLILHIADLNTCEAFEETNPDLSTIKRMLQVCLDNGPLS